MNRAVRKGAPEASGAVYRPIGRQDSAEDGPPPDLQRRCLLPAPVQRPGEAAVAGEC